MNCYKYCLFVSLVLFSNLTNGQVKPLLNGHAHNDYWHKRPLFDALENGFTSIEVDVLLIDGEVYVGHNFPDSTYTLPTLKDLYLLPLDSILKQNGGILYPGYDLPVYLMIDIKTDAERTYEVLKKLLFQFRSWIKIPGDERSPGKITVFLSGNRPVQTVIMDQNRLVSLDGRPEDLGRGYGVDLMPVISQNYNQFSKWQGTGVMPGSDQDRIRALAERVHGEGKRLRLWAHPDNPNTWTTLLKLGVDLINSDDLEGLQDYFYKN